MVPRLSLAGSPISMLFLGHANLTKEKEKRSDEIIARVVLAPCCQILNVNFWMMKAKK